MPVKSMRFHGRIPNKSGGAEQESEPRAAANDGDGFRRSRERAHRSASGSNLLLMEEF
jgi:hypothetical protein